MKHNVEFRGQAGEYFGIWIINILLTIITFGIYSAWAKVRTNRYFYGNTVIDGHSFDYHATGKQILIGRLIVFGAIVLFNITVQLAPVYALLLLIPYVAAFPWLINRGLRFQRRVTSYRNVRFDFDGSYWQAVWAFLLFPFLNIFAITLLSPLVSRTIGKFVSNHSKYGDRPFTLNMPVGPLYIVVVAKFIMIFILYAVAHVIAFYLLTQLRSEGVEFNDRSLVDNIVNPDFYIPLIIAGIIFYLIYFMFTFWYNTVLRNLVFGHLVLDDQQRFQSTITVLPYAWIAISNIAVTLLSLGFLGPWAKVRMARYLADNTCVIISGSLDDYTSQVKSTQGVVGDEFMDMEGIDVGFGA